jgi:hypothetical protein
MIPDVTPFLFNHDLGVYLSSLLRLVLEVYFAEKKLKISCTIYILCPKLCNTFQNKVAIVRRRHILCLRINRFLNCSTLYLYLQLLGFCLLVPRS